MASYNIKQSQNEREKKFTRDELHEMSTYRLRTLCKKYKIVKGYKKTQDREKLIELLYKYRGEQEPDLINQPFEKGRQRLQKILDNNLHYKIDAGDNIKIPAKIIIYRGLGLSREDGYKVICDNEVGESNVLLVNGNNELCGIMNLRKYRHEDNKYYLEAHKKNLLIDDLSNKNYSLLFFDKMASNYLYRVHYSNEDLPPRKLEYYKLPIIDFKIETLQETDTTLCIDFGTSNTTAGAYLDKNYISGVKDNTFLNKRINLEDVNFVKFSTDGNEDRETVEIIPTIVYVKDCKNPEDIKYLFGFRAKNKVQKNSYSGNASIFRGIKKWVVRHDEEIEVCDEAGNLAIVKRGDIVRAYIRYIIKMAENQFKCRFKNIHISTPVKLKEQFIKVFQEIIEDYVIEQEEVLDEGISVLYNTIANLIEKEKFENGREYKALVIDCGGGTTDLSSCKFRINKGDISYKVKIETGFENGDTNFGGNNITYRIMQFMKIAFSRYYREERRDIDIDSLISIPEGDIFRKIDNEGISNIYSGLEAEYRKAENVIPTRYKEYENKTASEYQMVKNNFHFLWEIAENMKKDFFRKTNILRNMFGSSDFVEQDTDLHVTALNRWDISVYDKHGMLEVKDEFPEIVFNIKEIKKLIKGDIYEIVRRFLEDLYETRKLVEYSIIKLTGQSCKINIFKEALKEFVPGRSIKFKQRKNNSLELKLSCLKGVTKYIQAKKMGEIEVEINSHSPVMPYLITAYTFTGKEKIIIDNQKEIGSGAGNILKPLSTSEMKFYLKDSQSSLKREYVYKNDFNDYQPMEVDKIIQNYKGKINQIETDKIENKQIKFFVFTSDSNWGFFVVPVARLEEQLYLGEEKYFPFDNDLSKVDFFDGYK